MVHVQKGRNAASDVVNALCEPIEQRQAPARGREPR